MMRKIFIIVACVYISSSEIIYSQVRENEMVQESKEKDTGYMFAFTEATKMFLFGDYAGAASLYSECLKYNPKSAAANYQIAEIYLKTGDVKKARKYSLAAYTLDQDNKWYILQIGNIYQSLQLNDSAVMMYKRLLNGTLRDIQVYYQIAAILEREKDYKQAMFYLENIEKEIGKTRETLVGKARIYGSMEMSKESLGQLRMALTGQDADYVIYGMIAEHYRNLGRKDSAQYYYEKIYYGHQEDANVVFSYGEFLLETNQMEKARNIYVALFGNYKIDENLKIRYIYNALQDQEFFRKVRPVMDTVTKVLLGVAPEKINIMSLYSDVSYRLGNYKASSLILRNIIDRDESNYKAWEQLLFCESALGNKDSVIYFGMKAINVFSNRPLPYLIMASVYYSDEKYEEALSLLKTGEPNLDTEALQIEYYSLLAECYGKTGNAAMADRYYEDALLLDSMNLGILNNYAYSLAVRNEDLKKAEKMSRITIESEPMSSTFLDTYAWVMFKSNMINEALKFIKRAVKLGGDKNAEILEHYGDILAKKGRKSKAFQIWTEAMDLGDEVFKERLRNKMKHLDSSF